MGRVTPAGNAKLLSVTSIGALPPWRGVAPYTQHLVQALDGIDELDVEALDFSALYPARLYPGGAFHSIDDGVQCAVRMVRRTLKEQMVVRLRGYLILKGSAEARFADSGFARNQDDLAVTVFCLSPATLESLKLLAPTNELGQILAPHSFRCVGVDDEDLPTSFLRYLLYGIRDRMLCNGGLPGVHSSESDEAARTST